MRPPLPEIRDVAISTYINRRLTNHCDFRLYFVLKMLCEKYGGECKISREEIAELCNVCVPTLRRCKNRLEKFGIIKITRRCNPNERKLSDIIQVMV